MKEARSECGHGEGHIVRTRIEAKLPSEAGDFDEMVTEKLPVALIGTGSGMCVEQLHDTALVREG